MEIYRGRIQLLDYVFYATVERGKVHETGEFLHNYALTYALGLPRGKTYTYTSLRQEPHYEEELTPLNGAVYITPGTPLKTSYRLVQWNTIRDNYNLGSRGQSLGYPDWGFARVLRPGSLFRCYFMMHARDWDVSPSLRDLLAGKATRVRLGKFPAKVRIVLERADNVRERTGACRVQTYLNWYDLGMDPSVCDVVATSLPTRLLSSSSFEGVDFYEARFGEERVLLPADMAYLNRRGG